MDLTSLQIAKAADLRALADSIGVPQTLADALVRHAVYGDVTGDFLTAFLANDLMDAVARADDVSVRHFRQIAQFIHCALGSECHGSREAVARWRETPMTVAKVSAHG